MKALDRRQKGSFLLLIAGGSLAYLAAEMQIDQLFSIGMALIGVAVIWGSLNTFAKGQVDAIDRQSMRREYYSGVPAYLIAAALLVAGIGLFFYSLWRALNPQAAAGWLDSLADSPHGWAVLLLVFGFFTFIFGLVRLLAGSAYEARHRTALVEFSFRAGGFISMVVGLFLLAGGVWLLVR